MRFPGTQSTRKSLRLQSLWDENRNKYHTPWRAKAKCCNFHFRPRLIFNYRVLGGSLQLRFGFCCFCSGIQMRVKSIERLVQLNQFYSQRRSNNYTRMMLSIFLSYMFRENIKIELIIQPNSGVGKLLLAGRKRPEKNSVPATAIFSY